MEDEEEEPVLGVTHAHLFLDCEASGGASNTPSEATLLGFDTDRFLVQPKLLERVNLAVLVPVEARL